MEKPEERDRDPDEIIGVRKVSPPDAATMALIKDEELPENEHTPEALAKFAEALGIEQPEEAPETPEAPEMGGAVQAQLAQMAELQRAQHQTMLAMKEQLEAERAERVKLQAQLEEQAKKVDDGQVHYKMPAQITEEQQWNLMVNDPNGLLG